MLFKGRASARATAVGRVRQVCAAREELAADDDIGEHEARWDVPAPVGDPEERPDRLHCPADRRRRTHGRNGTPADTEGIEARREVIGTRGEALAPRALRTPRNSLVQLLGIARKVRESVLQHRRGDAPRAVPAAADQEVWRQRLANMTPPTARTAHEDPMHDTALTDLARVGAVEGHRLATA